MSDTGDETMVIVQEHRKTSRIRSLRSPEGAGFFTFASAGPADHFPRFRSHELVGRERAS